MAGNTCYRNMRSGQNIFSVVCRIKSRLPSRSCCMAYFTIGRYTNFSVTWIGRCIKICLMTSNAGSWSIDISAFMTRSTSYRNMSTCERINCGMIESGRNPGALRMAGFAGFRKQRSGMIGLCSLVEVICVTPGASVWSRCIIPFVTIVAGFRNMSSGQHIIGIMRWKCSRFPSRIGGMTNGTIIGYIIGRVFWI